MFVPLKPITFVCAFTFFTNVRFGLACGGVCPT
jgi:hypothetical protein